MQAVSQTTAVPVKAATKNVVLTGNPNSGKTTLFNALTGLRARVGNYPGVTVERKEGRLLGAPKDQPVVVLDLPGAYSLSPQSLDEQISRDVLFHRVPAVAPPDLVVVSPGVFRGLLEQFPALRKHFLDLAAGYLRNDEKSKAEIDSVPLGDFLKQGLMNAQSLLVLDLEKCTRCDECTKACADAHDGVTRLIREGLRFDKYLVASSWRSCRRCRTPRSARHPEYCATTRPLPRRRTCPSRPRRGPSRQPRSPRSVRSPPAA